MSATDDAFAALEMFFVSLLGGPLPKRSVVAGKGLAAATSLEAREPLSAEPLAELRDMVQAAAAKNAAEFAALEARALACDDLAERKRGGGLQHAATRAGGRAEGLREALRLLRGEP